MGGCTHDDLDAEAPFGIQYSAHMAEIEYTELKTPRFPKWIREYAWL